MGAAVGKSDHRARIADQLRDAFLVELRHHVVDVEVVLQRQIEERIERVLAAFFGDLGDGFALQRFSAGLADLEHLDPMPFAVEQAGLFQFLAEGVAKCRVAINLLLLLGRLVEDLVPRSISAKHERIAQIDLDNERPAA